MLTTTGLRPILSKREWEKIQAKSPHKVTAHFHSPQLKLLTMLANRRQRGQLASQKKDVDEDCVNKKLALGRATGRWSPYNQCQSFVQDVIRECSTGKKMDPNKLPPNFLTPRPHD